MANSQRIGGDLGEKKVLADIQRIRLAVTNIIEDDNHPPWSFTIGLFETWDYPEFIVIGRSRATSYEILKTLAMEIEDNRQPRPKYDR
jgi:hypothetical protein